MTDSLADRRTKPQRGGTFSNASRYRRERRGDRSGRPVEQLLQCHNRHGNVDEVAALAHVVAPCAVLEFENMVPVADRLARPGTVETVMFETDTALAVWCGIEKGE